VRAALQRAHESHRAGAPATTNDAHRDYEDGEFRRARAIGIFAVKDGLPIGSRLEAQQIMRLMRETRRAT
jgi:hypothetical protein